MAAKITEALDEVGFEEDNFSNCSSNEFCEVVEILLSKDDQILNLEEKHIRINNLSNEILEVETLLINLKKQLRELING